MTISILKFNCLSLSMIILFSACVAVENTKTVNDISQDPKRNFETDFLLPINDALLVSIDLILKSDQRLGITKHDYLSFEILGGTYEIESQISMRSSFILLLNDQIKSEVWYGEEIFEVFQAYLEQQQGNIRGIQIDPQPPPIPFVYDDVVPLESSLVHELNFILLNYISELLNANPQTGATVEQYKKREQETSETNLDKLELRIEFINRVLKILSERE